MPWRRLCSARLCRMNGKFFHARSIRPRDFACSATFGAAPYSTGEHKPHIQTSRKTAKISRESYNTDAIYIVMFGGKAADLRKWWNLPEKSNVRNYLNTEQLHHIIAIENAITMQLDVRKITNPDHQLVIVNHVARSYKAMLEAQLPALQG